MTPHDDTHDTNRDNRRAPTDAGDPPSNRRPYLLQRDEGDHRHFLNHLATTKVAAGNDGSMTVVEFVAERGFGPPLHRHLDEDELFILLEGEVHLSSGEQTMVAREGATVFLPHGVAHTFQVHSDTARISTITASATGTPRFDRMVAELGTPIDGTVVPAPIEIDPANVAAVCAANGIEVLGPPPSPLPA